MGVEEEMHTKRQLFIASAVEELVFFFSSSHLLGAWRALWADGSLCLVIIIFSSHHTKPKNKKHKSNKIKQKYHINSFDLVWFELKQGLG